MPSLRPPLAVPPILPPTEGLLAAMAPSTAFPYRRRCEEAGQPSSVLRPTFSAIAGAVGELPRCRRRSGEPSRCRRLHVRRRLSPIRDRPNAVRAMAETVRRRTRDGGGDPFSYGPPPPWHAITRALDEVAGRRTATGTDIGPFLSSLCSKKN